MKKRLLAGFMCLLMAGCTAGSPIEEFDNAMQAEAVSVKGAQAKDLEAPYGLYIEKESALGLYEPLEGVYLGAYILSSKYVEYEIEAFETLAEKEHSMYTFYTKLGNPFPTDWVLSCIAGMKTPNIVLTPENESYPFVKSGLIATAKKFGEFYVPIFLQFFPDQRQKGYDEQEYIQFYREAREIFRQYASNVAFVWCAADEDMLDLNAYYPGDAYVDWVGVSIYETIDLEAEALFHPDVFDRIDSVYYTFQERKPIMVTQLGVSHFSSVDHAYYSQDCGDEIKRIYSKIANEYPRIKAICYMDYNGMDAVNQREGDDNFSITENKNVLAYYKEAIAGDQYLSTVDFSSGGEKFQLLVKSPFSAYKAEENYYISSNTLAYDFKIKDNSQIAVYGAEISGAPYYSLDAIKQFGYRVEIESAGRRIIAIKET